MQAMGQDQAGVAAGTGVQPGAATDFFGPFFNQDTCMRVAFPALTDLLKSISVRPLFGLLAGLALGLSGCQTAPPTNGVHVSTTPLPPQAIEPPPDVPAPTARDWPEPPPTSTHAPTPPQRPDRAQTASSSPARPTSNPTRVVRLPTVSAPTTGPLLDGRNIPAVKQLLAQARAQLQQAQLDQAEQSLRQVQRLAPQNPGLYAYLSELYLRRQQPDLAESAGRRGLLYAQGKPQQKAFWQLILLAAQAQRDPAKITQAQTALAGLD